MEIEAELVHRSDARRIVQPELQRSVSMRMGAKVTEVASSHVPMLSQPRFVLDVIRDAIKVVQG